MPTPTDPSTNRPTGPAPDQPALNTAEASADIWHAEPSPTAGTLSTRLAQLVLEQFTDTGDIVVDIDDDVTLARAAAEYGRRHHSLGGHNELLNLRHTTGAVHLVLMHWPQPPAHPRFLLAGCRALLAETGKLVIAIQVPAADRVRHLSALTGAARAVHLLPLRHIAVTDNTPRPAAARSSGQRGRSPGTPHTDLLVCALDADRHD